MFIMSIDGSQIVDSAFVERFRVDRFSDCARVLASYGEERKPVVLERYKTFDEAKDVLHNLLLALGGGQTIFYMPESLLFHEEVEVHDEKIRRRGGSGNHGGRRS